MKKVLIIITCIILFAGCSKKVDYKVISSVSDIIERNMNTYNDNPTVGIIDTDKNGKYQVFCNMNTLIIESSIGSYVREFSQLAVRQCEENDIPVEEYDLSMIQDGTSSKTATWKSKDGISGEFTFSDVDAGTWIHLENATPESIEAELGIDEQGLFDFVSQTE